MLFLSLDIDSVNHILDALDRKSLLALIRTCHKLNTDATPFLLRWVTLTSSPEQALGFLEYTASSTERSACVRSLRLCHRVFHRGNKRMADDDVFYVLAGPLLAELLERATYLEVFDCQMETLVYHEPRVALALMARPPSRCLALRIMGTYACKALRPIVGVRDLIVQLYPSPAEPSTVAALGDIILSCSTTLQSLVLYGTGTSFMSRMSNSIFLAMQKLRIEYAGSITMLPIQRTFPNLKSLGLGWYYPSEDDECLGKWPSLETFSGNAAFLPRLAPVCDLRHVRVYDRITTRDVLDQTMRALSHSSIESFRCEVEIKLRAEEEEAAGISTRHRGGVEASALARSLRESLAGLHHLDLDLTATAFKIAPSLHHTASETVISELATLKSLKYLAIRAACGTPYDEECYPYLSGEWPIPEPEFLACAFAGKIRSLEYFELDIPAIAWKDLWWRVERKDGAPWVRMVSPDEGRSARDWYQSYAFNPLTEYIGSSPTWVDESD